MTDQGEVFRSDTMRRIGKGIVEETTQEDFTVSHEEGRIIIEFTKEPAADDEKEEVEAAPRRRRISIAKEESEGEEGSSAVDEEDEPAGRKRLTKKTTDPERPAAPARKRL